MSQRHPVPVGHATGAALITAMLLVALVASLATVMLWQLAQRVQGESVQRRAQQQHALLVGATDWARVVLREDVRSSRIDHLGEPWAVPLKPVALSQFLNARDATQSLPPAQEWWLSGRITDAQSKFNAYELNLGSPWAEPAFLRLFAALGLPPAEAQLALRQWALARQAALDPTRFPQAPLLPQRLTQLVWLGLPASTVQRLQAHVVFLPSPTRINLNTASAEVLAAATTLTLAQTQRWVALRATEPATSLEAAAQRLGVSANAWPPQRFSVDSPWFEVQGQLRQDDSVLSLHSLVQRQGQTLRWVRAHPGPTAAARP